MADEDPGYWLDRYASSYHRWREEPLVPRSSTAQRTSVCQSRHERGAEERKEGLVQYARAHGLVETFFSCDGEDCGGRADMYFGLILELRTADSLGSAGKEGKLGARWTDDWVKRRVLLAWAALRVSHVLLRARAEERGPRRERWFVVEEVEGGADGVVKEAEKELVMIGRRKHGEKMDVFDFQRHCSNTARVVDAERFLAKMFLLPVEVSPEGVTKVSVVLVNGHEISDGMASYNWISHFIRLFNTSEERLLAMIEQGCGKDSTKSRLPPAQEELYPQIPGSKARQRWFWAITRILRHVRKPLPAGLTNPIRRQRREELSLPPKYADVLDYTPDRRPPLSSNYIRFTLTPCLTRTIATLSRQAGCTLGAATFALVALTMMELEEHINPDVPLRDRKPVILGFPLNIKQYINFRGPSDSCMLAFGDNFALPFLPTWMDRTGRFRLLLRQCQKRLSKFQKREPAVVPPEPGGQPSTEVTSTALAPTATVLARGEREKIKRGTSPLRILANGYVSQLDRGAQMLRPDWSPRLPFRPQGAVYPASVDATMQTNGISNVGDVRRFFDEAAEAVVLEDRARDVKAVYVDSCTGVRAREGEFLVACKTMGRGCGLSFSVSYDAGVMDERLVGMWREGMEKELVVGDVQAHL